VASSPAATARKKCSQPPGEQTSVNCTGRGPGFEKVWEFAGDVCGRARGQLHDLCFDVQNELAVDDEEGLVEAGVDVQGRAREPVRTLTVGYIAPLTRRMAAPALERFEQARPDVELTIHFASFLDPLGGLRDGPADVAILCGEFEHAGIALRPLFSEPRGVVLPAAHALAQTGDRLSLSQFWPSRSSTCLHTTRYGAISGPRRGTGTGRPASARASTASTA
jgi:DNA-binding transcriptional LysR family regulator